MNLFDIWLNFIGFFHDSIVLSLGILLFCGFFIGKLFEKLKLPALTGYIVSGLLLGESITGVIHANMSSNLTHITEIALGFIALTIGGEFSIAKMKRTGTRILMLTLFESLFAFAAVTAAMLLLGFRYEIALILGSISAATAPAATVVIIKELRARGDFVDHLYGVVAFDDAVCVILFGIVFAAVSPQLGGAAVHASVWIGLAHALWEVILSILLGLAGGIITHVLTIRRKHANEILLVSLALMFIVSALAATLHASPLLATMAMGATLINISHKNQRIFSYLEPLTPPIFAMFFILAGTEMHVQVLAHAAVMGAGFVYLLSRFAGKSAGILTAGLLTHTPAHIRRNLGFCLFPQAGVAIGLALFVQNSPVAVQAAPHLKASFMMIVNIILLSVFINELIGPAISRFGIKRGMDL
ncbi:MAG: cation:proton antiporter [candidate division KSB1 bacterium]|nr:cation:proton antiporter [candidate division KSB1 bacterium]